MKTTSCPQVRLNWMNLRRDITYLLRVPFYKKFPNVSGVMYCDRIRNLFKLCLKFVEMFLRLFKKFFSIIWQTNAEYNAKHGCCLSKLEYYVKKVRRHVGVCLNLVNDMQLNSILQFFYQLYLMTCFILDLRYNKYFLKHETWISGKYCSL